MVILPMDERFQDAQSEMRKTLPEERAIAIFEEVNDSAWFCEHVSRSWIAQVYEIANESESESAIEIFFRYSWTLQKFMFIKRESFFYTLLYARFVCRMGAVRERCRHRKSRFW